MAMSDAHKEALAEGRRQSRAIKQYLEALGGRPGLPRALTATERDRWRRLPAAVKLVTGALSGAALSAGAGFSGVRHRLEVVAEKRGVTFVNDSIATTPEESEALWQIRRSVSASLRKVNPDKYNEDICVPRSKVPEMIRRVDAIAEKFAIPIVNYGHAGDGNIHLNVTAQTRERMDRVEAGIRAILAKVLEMGGTISGEHGIGYTRRQYLAMDLEPAQIDILARIKGIFRRQEWIRETSAPKLLTVGECRVGLAAEVTARGIR